MMEATEVFHESSFRWDLLDDIRAECRTERRAQRLPSSGTENKATPCAARPQSARQVMTGERPWRIGRCAEVRPVAGVSWPRKAMRPLNSIGSID